MLKVHVLYIKCRESCNCHIFIWYKRSCLLAAEKRGMIEIAIKAIFFFKGC